MGARMAVVTDLAPHARNGGFRVFLETFGCQMNELDSELVTSQLRALGYSFTSEPDSAGVVLYNTCSVRDLAEQKVRSRLGELTLTLTLPPASARNRYIVSNVSRTRRSAPVRDSVQEIWRPSASTMRQRTSEFGGEDFQVSASKLIGAAANQATSRIMRQKTGNANQDPPLP